VAVGGSAQDVLHLHRFEHDERRAPRQLCAHFGEDARDRARHWRNDAGFRGGLVDLAAEGIDEAKAEASARGGQMQLAAGPARRASLRRIAETDLDPHP